MNQRAHSVIDDRIATVVYACCVLALTFAVVQVAALLRAAFGG